MIERSSRPGRQPVAYALFFTTFSTFIGKPGLYLEDLYVVKPHAVRRRPQLLEHMAGIVVNADGGREWSVWTGTAFHRVLQEDEREGDGRVDGFPADGKSPRDAGIAKSRRMEDRETRKSLILQSTNYKSPICQSIHPPPPAQHHHIKPTASRRIAMTELESTDTRIVSRARTMASEG